MKAVIVCPSERPCSPGLRGPLATVSFFGRPLICHWIEYLVVQGATEIEVLAADRPHIVRKVAGDGSRWGITLTVAPQRQELSIADARTIHKRGQQGWLAEPNDIVVADSLPGVPDFRVFDSYSDLFRAVQKFFPRAHGCSCVGQKEVSPGVWVGFRSNVAANATLIAPCWVSDYVSIGPGAVVGPWAILENRVIVEPGATISDSLIGEETFVGPCSIQGSLVQGNRLVRWETGATALVPDSFLMSSIREAVSFQGLRKVIGSTIAMLALAGTSPLAAAWLLAALARGGPIFEKREAVNPLNPAEAFEYYEFARTNGFWRRWPQLWNIACGNFAWVGNRPLSRAQAAELKTDFERLWLAAPVALFSLADTAQCQEEFSDEARAHAAFYAVQANWRHDIAILLQVMKRLLLPTRAQVAPPVGVERTPKIAVAEPLPLKTDLSKKVGGITDWAGGNSE